MKKNVFTFGLIAGAIVSGLMVITMVMYHKDGNQHGSMYLGYATMLIAFSMIFVAVKNYRDKYNAGEISFGKAFIIGLYIALIASTCYVITWLIIYYNFMPNFMNNYVAHAVSELKASGATQQEIAKQTLSLQKSMVMYKNPFWVMMFTYLEILPVGLVVALITALILKKRSPENVLVTS